MRLQSKRWATFLFLTFTLLACGGGGGGDDSTDPNSDCGNTTNTSLDYSGETKQAALTTENVDDIATAAASGSKQAISTNDVPLVGQRADAPVTQDQINESLSRLIGDALSRGAQLAGRGVTQPEPKTSPTRCAIPAR